MHKKGTLKWEVFILISILLIFNSLGIDINKQEDVSSVCIIDSGSNEFYDEGYDFVNDDFVPEDIVGHGTEMAFIIHEKSPDSYVYMAKVYHDSLATEEDMLNALDYCINKSVDVISISMSGDLYNGTCDEDKVAQKVNHAYSLGILITAAVGNDGKSVVSSPACAKNALRVGAFDIKGVSFSNNRYLDVIAPGYSVFKNGIGTSYSNAYVSGTILRLIEENILESKKEAKEELIYQNDVEVVKEYTLLRGEVVEETYGYSLDAPCIPTCQDECADYQFSKCDDYYGSGNAWCVCSGASCTSSDSCLPYVCVDGCLSDCNTNNNAKCSSGNYCYSIGSPDICSTGADGVGRCDNTDADCDAGNYCVDSNDYCYDGSADDLCESTAQCDDSSARCDYTYTRVASCVGASAPYCPCDIDVGVNDCPASFYNDSGANCYDRIYGSCGGGNGYLYTASSTQTCQSENGQACTGDWDCGSGICKDDYCCDTTCTGTCEACDVSGSEGTCTNIPDNQDLDTECSVTWTDCNDQCEKIGGDGFCDGLGACDTDDGTAYVAEGKVCEEGTGSEVDPSASDYCTRKINCTTDGCSASTWYLGCVSGGGACTEVNKQVAPTYLSPTHSVINENTYKVGTSCSVDYYGWCDTTDHCSGDDRYGTYTCDGTGTCDYDYNYSYAWTGCLSETGVSANYCDDDSYNACTSSECCNDDEVSWTSCSDPCSAKDSECISSRTCTDGSDSCNGLATSTECDGGYNASGNDGYCDGGDGDCLEDLGENVTCTTDAMCSDAVWDLSCDTSGSGRCRRDDGVLCGINNDGLCFESSHCDGICTADLANGIGCDETSDCTSTNCIDNYCCNNACGGTCDSCNVTGSLGACTSIPDDEDPEDECTTSWDTCDSVCVKRGPDGFCDGAGACDTNDATSYMTSHGNVCSGGSETTAGAGSYCDASINCTIGDCYASRWYRGCYIGSSACTETNKQVYASWNADVDTSISQTIHKVGTSCTTSGITACEATDHCSVDDRYDDFRCDGSGSCDNDYNLLWVGCSDETSFSANYCEDGSYPSCGATECCNDDSINWTSCVDPCSGKDSECIDDRTCTDGSDSCNGLATSTECEGGYNPSGNDGYCDGGDADCLEDIAEGGACSTDAMCTDLTYWRSCDPSSSECRRDNGQVCTATSECHDADGCLNVHTKIDTCTSQLSTPLCSCDLDLLTNDCPSSFYDNTSVKCVDRAYTTCSGGEGYNYTAAGSNTCETLKSDGTTCNDEGECSSTNCIDDYCCDTTCPGTCEACDVSGNEGTCTNISSKQDPDNECSITWTSCDSDCVIRGSDGFCGGNGACDTDGIANISSAYVCVGAGVNTSVSSTDYCNYDEDCDAGDCSATKWWTSCNGTGNCRIASDHTDAYSEGVDASSSYSLTDSCGVTGTTQCNLTWVCSDAEGDNEYDLGGYGYYVQGGCDGSGNCDYAENDPGADDSAEACECEITGTQTTCDNAESNCWENYAGGMDCCVSGETSCDGTLGNTAGSCISGTYRTDEDNYSEICGCITDESTTADDCNVDSEADCWDGTGCCYALTDDWCDGGAGVYQACSNGVWYNDEDSNMYACVCGMNGNQNADSCDYNTEADCWDGTGCCQDVSDNWCDDGNACYEGKWYDNTFSNNATCNCRTGREWDADPCQVLGDGTADCWADNANNCCYQEDDNWCDGGAGIYEACYNGTWYDNQDSNQYACVCGLNGDQNADDCDTDNEGACYSTNQTKCCGDGGDDLWCDGVNAGCVSSNYRIGGDSDQYICETCGSFNWSLGGDVAPTECCGDDAAEYDLTMISVDANLTSNSSDDACCNNQYDCVYNSQCYDNGTLTNIFGDYRYERCINSGWYDGGVIDTSLPYFNIINNQYKNLTLSDQHGRFWISGFNETWSDSYDDNNFLIRNSTDEVVAWIDSVEGSLYLRGTIYDNTGLSPSSSGNVVLQNSTDDAVVWFTNDGDLYIKKDFVQDVCNYDCSNDGQADCVDGVGCCYKAENDWCDGSNACSDGVWYNNPDSDSAVCNCNVGRAFSADTCQLAGNNTADCWADNVNNCCYEASDDWCDGGIGIYEACYDGVWYDNRDTNQYSCVCGLNGDQSVDDCDANSEADCWDGTGCCYASTDDWCDGGVGIYEACRDGTWYNDEDANQYACVCGLNGNQNSDNCNVDSETDCWDGTGCCYDITDDWCDGTNACHDGVWYSDDSSDSAACNCGNSKAWDADNCQTGGDNTEDCWSTESTDCCYQETVYLHTRQNGCINNTANDPGCTSCDSDSTTNDCGASFTDNDYYKMGSYACFDWATTECAPESGYRYLSTLNTAGDYWCDNDVGEFQACRNGTWHTGADSDEYACLCGLNDNLDMDMWFDGYENTNIDDCDSNSEADCWDGTGCCYDASDTWCDGGIGTYQACKNGVWYNDVDLNQYACYCGLSGNQDADECDTDDEGTCYSTNQTKCCGDGADDNWCEGPDAGCVTGGYQLDAENVSYLCETCSTSYWNLTDHWNDSYVGYCCENDDDEAKRTRVNSNADTTTDPNDDACCYEDTDCVYNNTCYNYGYETDIFGNSRSETCIDGTWWQCYLSASLHVAYFGENNYTKYATSCDNGETWFVTTVDNTTGGLGSGVSIVVNEDSGQIHISYHHYDNKSLKHANSSDGITWEINTVDSVDGTPGIGESMGKDSKIIMDSNDTIYIFYRDIRSSSRWYLKRAISYDNGKTWSKGFVDGGGSSFVNKGEHIDVVLDSNEDIHLVYKDCCDNGDSIYDDFCGAGFCNSAWTHANSTDGVTWTKRNISYCWKCGGANALSVSQDNRLFLETNSGVTGLRQHFNSSTDWTEWDGETYWGQGGVSSGSSEFDMWDDLQLQYRTGTSLTHRNSSDYGENWDGVSITGSVSGTIDSKLSARYVDENETIVANDTIHIVVKNSSSNKLVYLKSIDKGTTWTRINIDDNASGSPAMAIQLKPGLILADITQPNVTLIVSNSCGYDQYDTTPELQYSVTDDRDNYLNCSLYINSTGTFQQNGSSQLTRSGETGTFPAITLIDGEYRWNVKCVDDGNNSAFATNDETLKIYIWHDTGGSSSTDSVAVNQSTLYKGGSGDTVYRYDGGTTWTSVGGGTNGDQTYALISFNNTIYAGKDNSDSIYRYDGGSSWTNIGGGGLGSDTLTFVVYNGALYAGKNTNTIYRYDGDITWTSVGTPSLGGSVRTLVVFNNTIYAGGSNDTVYRYDGGTTWTDIGGGTAGTITLTLGVLSGKLYAGKFGSSVVYRYDGDTTWTSVGGDTTGTSTLVLVNVSNRLFAGKAGSDNVYMFDTKGWMSISGGTAGSDVREMIFNNGESRLYVGKFGANNVYYYEGAGLPPIYGTYIVTPPTDMCASGTDGLKCEETAATNYCGALGYTTYTASSKSCDSGSHATGSWADNEGDSLHYNCDGTGSAEWISTMDCWTCESGDVYGCRDADACNYDSATTVDIPCLYNFECNNDCDGSWSYSFYDHTVSDDEGEPLWFKFKEYISGSGNVAVGISIDGKWWYNCNYKSYFMVSDDYPFGSNISESNSVIEGVSGPTLWENWFRSWATFKYPGQNTGHCDGPAVGSSGYATDNVPNIGVCSDRTTLHGDGGCTSSIHHQMGTYITFVYANETYDKIFNINVNEGIDMFVWKNCGTTFTSTNCEKSFHEYHNGNNQWSGDMIVNLTLGWNVISIMYYEHKGNDYLTLYNSTSNQLSRDPHILGMHSEGTCALS